MLDNRIHVLHYEFVTTPVKERSLSGPSKARSIGRFCRTFLVVCAATDLAYFLDVRRDLGLGFGFYSASMLLTSALAITSRIGSPQLVASVSAAATVTGLVLGFLWRLPVGDNDGLWLFQIGYLGVLVCVETLACFELVERKRMKLGHRLG